jgi:hypothetical protein
MTQIGLSVRGFVPEPLDVLSHSEYELTQVGNLNELLEGLVQYPALGTIETIWPIPDTEYDALIYFTFRATSGHSNLLDYVSSIVPSGEFTQLSKRLRESYYRFHLEALGTLPRAIWITIGEAKDYFPALLGDKETVALWRQGRDLIPLDYTWVKREFFELLRPSLPRGIAVQPSELLRDKRGEPFIRMHPHEPL